MWQKEQENCLMTQILNCCGEAILCRFECGDYYREHLYHNCDRVPGRMGTVQTVVNSTSAWISAVQIVRADTDALMCCEENNMALFLPIRSLPEPWFHLFSFSVMGFSIPFYFPGFIHHLPSYHTFSTFPFHRRMESSSHGAEARKPSPGHILQWQPMSQQPMPPSPTMEPHPAICLINLG